MGTSINASLLFAGAFDPIKDRPSNHWSLKRLHPKYSSGLYSLKKNRKFRIIDVPDVFKHEFKKNPIIMERLLSFLMDRSLNRQRKTMALLKKMSARLMAKERKSIFQNRKREQKRNKHLFLMQK
ncbi:MAG: hypothetical protein JKY09_01075 [Crocinitomicaceae bacterium]|nr:hypothetical protein [Crocinitomicaceae bacterium]